MSSQNSILLSAIAKIDKLNTDLSELSFGARFPDSFIPSNIQSTHLSCALGSAACDVAFC